MPYGLYNKLWYDTALRDQTILGNCKGTCSIEDRWHLLSVS